MTSTLFGPDIRITEIALRLVPNLKRNLFKNCKYVITMSMKPEDNAKMVERRDVVLLLKHGRHNTNEALLKSLLDFTTFNILCIY